jgi:sulfur-oxidizing protein SoxA
LEADSFQNPGMLYLERGEEIWNAVEVTMGKSCASCHQDASVTMKDVGAHFPKWDADAKRPINVELQIDKCRVENMGAEAYKFDSDDQKALTTYIKYQSLGTPVSIDLAAGDMQCWWDKG